MSAERNAKLVLEFDTMDAQRSAESMERAGERLKTKVDEATSALERQTRVAAAAGEVIDRYGDGLATPTKASRTRTRRDKAARAEADYLERFQWEQDRLEAEVQADAMRRRDAIEQADFGGRIRGRLHDQGLVDARGSYQQRRDAERDGPLDAINSALSGGGMAALAGRAIPYAAMAYGVDRSFRVAEVGAQVNARRDLTNAQKANLILDEASFGFTRRLREFSNALDGTTERVRQAGLRLEMETAVQQMRAGQQMQLQGMEFHVASAENRAAVLGGATLPSVSYFDRSTFGGRVAHQEEQQRIGVRDAAAAADRDAAAARMDAQSARQQLARIEQRLGNATRQRLGWERNERGFLDAERGAGNRQVGGRADAGTGLALAMQRENAILQQRIELARQSERAGVAAAQAEARAREAHIAVMRTELSILQQREGRLLGMAERLGEMSFLDRAMGEAAMNAVRTQGVQNVTREIRDRARAFNPEEYQARVQQFGMSTPEFQRERNRNPQAFGTQSVAELQSTMADLQTRIRQETLDSQRELARSVADTLGATLREIRDLFMEQLEQLRREIRAGRRRSNNSQG